jgi:hypothetical protein
MGETPSQTSRDRNLSEGSIVGPYTSNSPPRSQPRMDFNKLQYLPLALPRFSLLVGDISRSGGMDRDARLAARILEHRPQRCGDARPFAGPPSSGRRNSASGVCAAAVGGGYRVIDLALAERSARLYRRLSQETNRSGSADLEQGARPNRVRNRVRKNFAVIPGRPLGPGPESKNTGQTIDFISPCSWIPGSRAKPAPRNDHPSAFFPQPAS